MQGNTDLKGAVIASNQTAIQTKKNQLTTGTLTTSNLENSAEFDADAIGFSASVSITKKEDVTGLPTPLSAGGVGEQSGKAQSTTLSGISASTITITDEEKQQALTGQDATTTVASLNREVDSDKDTSNALDRIFDEQTVQRDIDGQVLITQEFGKVAPKAVADVTAGLAKQLLIEALAVEKTDPTRAAALKAEAAKYDEGGEYRVALQTVVGGLSGGVDGALGAGVIAQSVDLLKTLQNNVVRVLLDAGVDKASADVVSQGISQLTALGIGKVIGGTNGAVVALAVDTNNRQLHQSEIDKARRYVGLFRKVVQRRGGEITEEEAEGRLIRTLLRIADLETDQADGFRVDEEALSFLAKNFISVTESDRRDPTINQDVLLANVNVFANAALQGNTGLTPFEKTERNNRAGASVAKGLGIGFATVVAAPVVVNATRSCLANILLCLNELGITASEAALPEGLALTGTGVAVAKGVLKDGGKVVSKRVVGAANSRPFRDIVSELSTADKTLIKNVETFEPLGVSTKEAERFITNTSEGRELFDTMLRSKGSNDTVAIVKSRAIDLIRTGIDIPIVKEISTPLVKVVPSGGNLSAFSPFFTTQKQIDLAQKSGRSITDFFGLPASSDAARFGIFEVTPKNSATIFESVVAPTTELRGVFKTKGGAIQIIVPDRSQFTEPRFIEIITNK